MRSSPLLDQFPYERDSRGRLVTDQFCRVQGATNIWAGGDCAAVSHSDGGTCPPLAHYLARISFTHHGALRSRWRGLSVGCQRLTEATQKGEIAIGACCEGQTIRHGAHRHGV